MKKPINIVLIGAGSRGRGVYARYIQAQPNQFCLVAVADPIAARREMTATHHNIPPERQFVSWQELFARPQLGQAAIIATPDQDHLAPALAALQNGYDVLLEKPMAHRQNDCVTLVNVAKQMGRLLQICHVLRYTPVMQKVKEILETDVLGEIITISHRENVSFWHMAHSYVRGNWRNTAQSSPMILAKCSHDFDLLYWLLERPCEQLSSVGSLRHFGPAQAPEGAPPRCTDGCPIANTCSYEATNIYLHLHPLIAELSRVKHPLYRGAGQLIASKLGQTALHLLSQVVPPLRQVRDYHGWPRSIISDEPGEAAIRRALESGPYGRCVYYSDNNVVDHQVVMMEFEGGISATLTMHGHSHQEGRTMRIDGAKGTLFVRMNLFESEIKVHHNRTRHMDRYYIPHAIGQGHGGGDRGLMGAFYQALTNCQQAPLTTAQASLESHLMAFAAEKARLERTVIKMKDYRRQALAEAQTSANGQVFEKMKPSSTLSPSSTPALAPYPEAKD